MGSAFRIGEAGAAMAGVPKHPWVGGRHAQPLITEKEAQACGDRPPQSPGRWLLNEERPPAWTLNTGNCHCGGRDVI